MLSRNLMSLSSWFRRAREGSCNFDQEQAVQFERVLRQCQEDAEALEQAQVAPAMRAHPLGGNVVAFPIVPRPRP